MKKKFLGVLARGDETHVATFADLKNFVLQLGGRERELLVGDDLSVETYGTTPNETPGLAVGFGEAGEFDEVDDPNFIALRENVVPREKIVSWAKW